MEEEFNMHCKYGSSNRFALIKNEYESPRVKHGNANVNREWGYAY